MPEGNWRTDISRSVHECCPEERSDMAGGSSALPWKAVPLRLPYPSFSAVARGSGHGTYLSSEWLC